MHWLPWMSSVAGLAIVLKGKVGRAAAAMLCTLSLHAWSTVAVLERYQRYYRNLVHA